MANNRLYLRDSMGNEICLAKYFPSTGWFTRDHDLAYHLNEFLQKHDGSCHNVMNGNVDHRVVYESDDVRDITDADLLKLIGDAIMRETEHGDRYDVVAAVVLQALKDAEVVR